MRLTVCVSYVKSYGSRLVIKFRGYSNPESVARLRGAHLLVPRSQTHPLPEDTFYVFDIVGLDAVTESGDVIGRVKDVLSLPGNDVYVVDQDGEELLIPAVRSAAAPARAWPSRCVLASVRRLAVVQGWVLTAHR